MKKSMFQFKNPHIEKISFEINNNIPCEDDIPLGINVQTFLSNDENNLNCWRIRCKFKRIKKFNIF